MTPHNCPVCDGRGKVPADIPAGTAFPLVQCPACHGTWIVWEPDAPVMPPFDERLARMIWP